jgi:beta-xylosidase
MGGHIRVFHSSAPGGPYTDGGRIATGYDPGFFADEDGQLYLTRAGGEIYRLSPDGLRADGEPLFTVAGGEGPEIFKRNGWYYYIISPGGTRPYQDHRIMSYRAKRLYHDPGKNIWLTTTVVDGRKVFEVGCYDKPFVSDVDPADLEPSEIMKTLRNAPKVKTILARAANAIGNTVFLKMSIDGQEHVRFFFSADGEDWAALEAKVYFGDCWHNARLGKKAGAPDLGWVGCGRDNVWTGTTMGIFACRNGATRSTHADFQHFQVITH